MGVPPVTPPSALSSLALATEFPNDALWREAAVRGSPDVCCLENN
jgi:hypothetical protein